MACPQKPDGPPRTGAELWKPACAPPRVRATSPLLGMLQGCSCHRWDLKSVPWSRGRGSWLPTSPPPPHSCPPWWPPPRLGAPYLFQMRPALSRLTPLLARVPPRHPAKGRLACGLACPRAPGALDSALMHPAVWPTLPPNMQTPRGHGLLLRRMKQWVSAPWTQGSPRPSSI